MNSPILKAGQDLPEYGSGAAGEFANPYARDAAFEQLLRLAASFASGEGRSHAPVRKSPLIEDIESRAYHNYLGRGAADGHDLDDWLQAERQVLEELKKNKASLRLALAFGLLKDSAER